MTVVRTNPPDAGAAKITLIGRPYYGIARGSAARFPQTGHSNRGKWPKLNPAVRCDGVECLTCGLSRQWVNVRFPEVAFRMGLSLPVRSLEGCRGHSGPFPKRPRERCGVGIAQPSSCLGNRCITFDEKAFSGILS